MSFFRKREISLKRRSPKNPMTILQPVRQCSNEVDRFVSSIIFFTDAREIAFLESGLVRAYYLNGEGKEYNKTFFSAPGIIGSYASLISKQKNKVAQQALTDCKIWRTSFHHIEAHSKDNIELERLRRIIAEKYFLSNEQKELEMAMLDADKRYLILRETYPGIEQEVPQYHIAAYLGISPTQLSRIRKKISR